MASVKRQLSREVEPEPEAKRARVDDDVDAVACVSRPDLEKHVVLNPADCDLDFDIEENGLKGAALHQEGFAYCWSGARSNVGINGGKYCFGCKIISIQSVNMEDTPLDQQHVCRVGISGGDEPIGNLGETEHSFGFGGTGKFSNAGKFSDFSEKFGVGDTIVCAVDLESRPLASIGFSKNGKWLGTAKQFDASLKGLGVVDSVVKGMQFQSAVFPHVLLKNVVILMQFRIEDGLVPVEGYKPWVSALDDGNAILGPTFSNVKDCEVIIMVGLPASGKTTWAEKWVKDHPEQRYVLLGTNAILDRMKVHGLLRKHNYSERFERLMGRANAMFDILLSRAARTPRNYVIDQTNVFKSARKRKLRPFADFQKIAVVVFPKPEELKIRSDKRFEEMGKEVPADAVNNMLANYVLPMSKDMPGSDEHFDKVMFVELDRGEAQKHLDEMKQALCSASNSDLQTNYPPYSHESPVDSFIRPSLKSQGALLVSSGQWQSSYPPLPQLNYSFQRPNQVNSAYQQAGSYSEMYRGQHYQNPPVPRGSTPYGTCLSNEISAVPGDKTWYTERYGALPGGRIDPYQSYGVVDPYCRPGSVADPYRPSMVEPSFMGSARASPFTNSAISGQFSPIVCPQADWRAPRPPTISPGPPSYGSPYGTPMTRPSNGNFPTNMRRRGRNASSYPR